MQSGEIPAAFKFILESNFEEEAMPDTPRMKLARILYALLHRPDGLTCGEIMERYEINDKRTLRDYLRELKDMKELIVDGEETVRFSGRGADRRVFLRQRYTPPADTCHIVALYFALCMMRFLRGTKLEDQAEKLYESLYKGENKNLLRHLEQKIYSINEWPKDYSHHRDIVRRCIEALIYQKRLKISYRRPGGREQSQHELKIYTLVQYRNGLYLLAESDKGKNVTTFAVERIVSVEITGNQFQYPVDFSPQKHLDGAFGIFTSDEKKNVVVHFDGDVKDNVSARQWHPSQKIEILKNGNLKLTMRVGSLTQVVPWILSYGQLAQVIEPDELKDRIKDDIRGMKKKYRMR